MSVTAGRSVVCGVNCCKSVMFWVTADKIGVCGDTAGRTFLHLVRACRTVDHNPKIWPYSHMPLCPYAIMAQNGADMGI